MPSKQDPPPRSDDDLAMSDAPAASSLHEEEDPNPTNLAFNEQRIRIVRVPPLGPANSPLHATLTLYLQLPGSSDTAASFEFKKEDHTLGNALRYIIMKKYAVSLSLLLKILLQLQRCNI